MTTGIFLRYQWKKNGTDISGATSSTYTTPATVIGDNGAVFSVAVTSGGTTVTSNTAALLLWLRRPRRRPQLQLRGSLGACQSVIGRRSRFGLALCIPPAAYQAGPASQHTRTPHERVPAGAQ
ncbi:MAG: hypothetical protein ORN28_09065 [Rhodoferax sp.]|nr:hypothetical protein [Rhodoferax sp.]